MSSKFKVGLLVGIFLITAFAFAENGGQLQPAASVAVSQAAAAAALPETPTAAQKPAVVPPAKPLGITVGNLFRFRSDDNNNTGDFTNKVNDEGRNMHVRFDPFVQADFTPDIYGYGRLQWEPYKKWYVTCTGTAGVACTTAGFKGKSISTPFNSQALEVDSAYLFFKKLPGLKNATLQIGRFDKLALADGFFWYGGHHNASFQVM